MLFAFYQHDMPQRCVLLYFDHRSNHTRLLLQQLLHTEDRKPSQLLHQMLKLRGGTTGKADQDEIFREIYLQVTPYSPHSSGYL